MEPGATPLPPLLTYDDFVLIVKFAHLEGEREKAEDAEAMRQAIAEEEGNNNGAGDQVEPEGQVLLEDEVREQKRGTTGRPGRERSPRARS